MGAPNHDVVRAKLDLADFLEDLAGNHGELAGSNGNSIHRYVFNLQTLQ